MLAQNKKTNGFTQHLESQKIAGRRVSAKRPDLGAGFIPLLLMLLLVIAVIIWLAYRRVN